MKIINILQLTINRLTGKRSQLSIVNCYKLTQGFTLVELLAAIVVLAICGTIIVGIVTTALRGTNKTNNVEAIRQNGNYALTRIAKSIEYAEVFHGLSNNGTDYVRTCPHSASPTPVPIKTDYEFLKLKPFGSSSSIIYSCSLGPILRLGNDSLIDTNSISLKSCSISCIQKNLTDVPIIRISFKLRPKNSIILLEGSTPDIVFQTSVTPRNFKK